MSDSVKIYDPVRMSNALRAKDAEITSLRASHARMLDALHTMRSLIKEGGVPRYIVTPGAALNSFVEEVLDPILEPQLLRSRSKR